MPSNEQLLDQIKQKLATYDDATPILLLPVRIETRFMTIKYTQPKTWTLSSDMVTSLQNIETTVGHTETLFDGGEPSLSSYPIVSNTLVPAINQVAEGLTGIARLAPAEYEKLSCETDLLCARALRYDELMTERITAVQTTHDNTGATHASSGDEISRLENLVADLGNRVGEPAPEQEGFHIQQLMPRIQAEITKVNDKQEPDAPETLRDTVDTHFSICELNKTLDSLTTLDDSLMALISQTKDAIVEAHGTLQQTAAGKISETLAELQTAQPAQSSLQNAIAGVQSAMTNLSAVVVGEEELHENDIPTGTRPGHIVWADPVTPPDAHELWLRIYPDDIAVTQHEELLSAPEESWGHKFWNAVWDSPGDSAVLKAAWDDLLAVTDAPRAAYIKQQTTPTNVASWEAGSPGPISFPTLTLRSETWLTPATTRVMPDRFVVIAWARNMSLVQHVGNPVDSELQVGFNPALTDPGAYTQDGDNELVMDADIEWMSDFSQAVAKGMGIRIPLENGQQNVGFARILVLGLRLSEAAGTAASVGQSDLEALLNTHHYAVDGMSLLPQGTPTNNTSEARAGYKQPDDDNAISFATECSGDLFVPQPLSNPDYCLMRDGQWFADALGIDYSVMQHILHADGLDMRDGIVMNQALWPATFGHYLETLLNDLFLDADMTSINRLRDFFTMHVSGRGFIPALRVGDQPYGVVPVTAWTRWQWNSNDSASNSYRGFLENYTCYVENLYKWWQNFVNTGKVMHIDLAPDPGLSAEQKLKFSQQKFLNIMGLNPTSIDYFMRNSVGQGATGNIIDFMYTAENELGEVESLTEGDYAKLGKDILFDIKNSFPYLSRDSNILKSVFVGKNIHLTGPSIEVLPDSELHTLAEGSDNQNYIERLCAATVPGIRGEIYPGLFTRETSLLYLLLRQALVFQNYDSTMTLLDEIAVLDNNQEESAAAFTTLPDNPDEGHLDRVRINFSTQDAASYTEGSLIRISGASEAAYNGVFPIVNVQDAGGDLVEVDIVNESASSEFDGQALGAGLAITADYGYGTAARKSVGRLAAHNLDQHEVQAGVSAPGAWEFMLKPVKGFEEFGDLSISPTAYFLHHLESHTYANAKKYLREVKKAMGILADLPTAKLERLFAEHLDLCSYRIDAWKMGMVHKRLRRQRGDQRTGIYLGAYAWVENLLPGTRDAVPVERIPKGYENDDTLAYDSKNQGFIHGPSVPHAVAGAILRSGYHANAENTPDKENLLAVNISSERVRIALNYIEGIRGGQSMNALLGYQFERGLHDRMQEMDSYIHLIRAKYPLVADVIDPNATGAVETLEANNVVDGMKLLNAGPFPYGITALNSIPPAKKTIIQEEVQRMADAMDAVADLGVAESVYATALGNQERARAVGDALSKGGNPPSPELLETPRSGQNITQRVAMLMKPITESSGLGPRASAEPTLNNFLLELIDSLENVKCMVYYGPSESQTEVEVSFNNLILPGTSPYSAPIDHLDLLYLVNDELNNDATQLSELLGFYVRVEEDLPDSESIEVRYKERDPGWSNEDMTVYELAALLRPLFAIINGSRALDARDFVPPLVEDVDDDNPLSQTEPGVDLANVAGRINDAFCEGGGPCTNGLSWLIDHLQDQRDGFAAQTEDGPFTQQLFIDLRQALLDSGRYGIVNATPVSAIDEDSAAYSSLLAQADSVLKELNARKAATEKILAKINGGGLSDAKTLQLWHEAAKGIFGKSFTLIPLFSMGDFPTGGSVQSLMNDAIDHSDNFLAHGDIADFAMEDWVHGLARVRPRMRNYESFRLLAENFAMPRLSPAPWKLEHTPLQLPFDAGSPPARWMGLPYPNGYSDPGNKICFVLQHYGNLAVSPDPYLSGSLQAGILVDEWTEVIPSPEETSGVAFHYDQPNARAPQSMLLAVTPRETGSWSWDDLVTTMHETVNLSKARAVEPDHFKDTPLEALLPALLAPITKRADVMAMDLGANNDSAFFEGEANDDSGTIQQHETGELFGP